jgi:tripartite-type tricarboxylate transporter receptor subunit TctC
MKRTVMKHVPSLLRASVIAVAALSTVPHAARAQAYPSQDVSFICGFAAGSGADIIVRYFAEKLRPLMNRTIIVQNKPGALGNIATEFVARSKPAGIPSTSPGRTR